LAVMVAPEVADVIYSGDGIMTAAPRSGTG
jgi:hypothetical protein